VKENDKPAPDASHQPEQSGDKAKRLRNLKGHIPGPGRVVGSKNRFNQAAITNFVNNYRSDLATDWEKHGAEFVAQCRAKFPQVYASMQVKRLEEELSRTPVEAGEIIFRWDPGEPAPQPPQEPQKALPYYKPTLPADLQPEDWSLLLQTLELIKRTIPSNSDTPPGEIFELLRKALLEHFRETEPA
jgi:hypothetical protein